VTRRRGVLRWLSPSNSPVLIPGPALPRAPVVTDVSTTLTEATASGPAQDIGGNVDVAIIVA
jgi:hypothetical protein